MNNKKIICITFIAIFLVFSITPVLSSGQQTSENQEPSENQIRSIAEFEPAKELLISWPNWWLKADDGYILDPYYVNLTRTAQEYIMVNIMVNSKIHKNKVISLLEENQVPLNNVTFSIIPTSSIWIRDYGPFFVEEDNQIKVVDLQRYGYFNKKYYLRFLDDFFPTLFSLKYGFENKFIGNFFLAIQGGNYLTDGNGTGFIGDRVFKRDNPFIPEDKLINYYKTFLGLKEVVILKSELINTKIGTKIIGHLGMSAKMVDENTFILGEYTNKSDLNYHVCEDNCALLESLGYNIYRVPTVGNPDKYRPFTYLNSIIINNGDKKVVILPTYDIPEDEIAISIFQQAMPEYEIVGVDCRVIIKASGAVHCTTICVPAGNT